ncbi:MAG: hypothetical protein JWP29_5478 [Rhodoferax sp.]|nr:hypothetical protein [Rhodoferax sp.]
MANFLRALTSAALLHAVPLIGVSAMAMPVQDTGLTSAPGRLAASQMHDARLQDIQKSALLHLDEGITGLNQRRINANTALPAGRAASAAITPDATLSSFSAEPVSHVDDEAIASPSVILASLAMVVLIALRRMAG